MITDKRPFTLMLTTLVVLNLLVAPVSSRADAYSHNLNTSTGNAQLEPIAQLGGSLKAVAFQTPYIYVGVGPRLVILDPATPSNPVPIGQTGVLSGGIDALAADGSYIFVATDDSKLYAIDVTNPAIPVTLSFMNIVEPLNDIQVAGTYAYAAAGGSGLRIFDISNPAAPSEIGHLDTPGTALAVAITGNYAYLAAQDAYLRIIDISSPKAPVEAGFYDQLDWASDVAVMGSYLYVTDGGLVVLDISNRTAPSLVSSIWLMPSFLEKLGIRGNFAYVSANTPRYNSYGMTVIDISNPSDLSVANYGIIGGYSPGNKIVTDIALAEDYAFIVDGSALHVLNTTSLPASLTQTGLYYPDFSLTRYVDIENDSLRVASDRLSFADITRPITPTVIGFYPNAGDTDIAINGDYAYVRGYAVDIINDSWLSVIDITNPASPTEISYSYAYAGSPATDVVLSGKYAYLSTQYVLVTFDVSNPTMIRPVVDWASYWPHGANDLAVDGKYVYIASTAGLSIVDMTDPAVPVQVGFWHNFLCTSFYAVTVRGNYAYVTCHEGGVRIIDVSDPTNPTEVGFFNTPGTAMRIEVVNNYAYIADGNAGVSIFDISQPSNAKEIASYDTAGFSNDVAVDGNYVYVADGVGGLVILRLATDQIIQTIPVSGGQVISGDENTQLVFPKDAFSDPVSITYRQFLYDEHTGEFAGIGRIFDVTGIFTDTGKTADLAPGQTFTITVHYSDTQIGPAIESTLGLYSWNGSSWVRETNSTLDSQNNTLTAVVNHLSLWAVLGETRREYLPTIIRGV